MQRHKIPIHLEQPDFLLLGLNARQCALICAGIGSGYSTWSMCMSLFPDWWGLLLSTLLGLLVTLICCLAAFLSWRGRSLEVWAIIGMVYLGTPKLWLWSPLDYHPFLWEEEDKPAPKEGKLKPELKGEEELW